MLLTISSSQATGKGISSRVFVKVGIRTELIIVPDATQPVSLWVHIGLGVSILFCEFLPST